MFEKDFAFRDPSFADSSTNVLRKLDQQNVAVREPHWQTPFALNG